MINVSNVGCIIIKNVPPINKNVSAASIAINAAAAWANQKLTTTLKIFSAKLTLQLLFVLHNYLGYQDANICHCLNHSEYILYMASTNIPMRFQEFF